MIPSAFNFVPLSENVYFPDWSEKVSMDIPFSDGICGEITIELTTSTPVYVRSGGVHPTDNRNENELYTDFFRVTPGGSYAIPGTSIKGVIRNVLEIASFGKITTQNRRYGVRDLYNKDYSAKLTAIVKKQKVNERMIMDFKPLVRAGWLEESDESVRIVPCDFARIQQTDIERHFLAQQVNVSIGTDDPEVTGAKESSVVKYGKLSASALSLVGQFNIQAEQPHPHSCGNLRYKQATFVDHGGVTGTLVLTGQPARREFGQRGRKHLEFVFFNEARNITQVAQEVFEEFKFIHSDDKGKPNEEWEYWQAKLYDHGRVPVFYLADDRGHVTSMGLAMMYRLPYEKTIHDAVRNTSEDHFSTKKDLAETIFGYIDDKDALRGRVQFDTMLADGNPEAMPVVHTVLNGPKPTFYPFYIEQKNLADAPETVEKYSTFMDPDCEIRGWKRYPVKREPNPAPVGPDQRGDVSTAFRPLPEGTRFRGRIHVHNLRKTELGALLWSLTMGGNDNCHHSIGMAKPYGYGASKIKIVSGALKSNKGDAIDIVQNSENLISQFIKTMNDFLQNTNAGFVWSDSPQIQNLLAMGTFDHPTCPAARLRYPVMDMRGNNGFRNMKSDKVYLEPFVPYRQVLETRPREAVQAVRNLTTNSAGFRSGMSVECEVTERRTKKDKPILSIVGGGPDDYGFIAPNSRIPDDLSPGKKYAAKLKVYDKTRCQFEIE